jgi:hypothetical protein
MVKTRTKPKPITINEPVNSTMICERLKIDASALSQWQARYDTFPEPKIHLGVNTKIWEWDEVKAWHKQYRG